MIRKVGRKTINVKVPRLFHGLKVNFRQGEYVNFIRIDEILYIIGKFERRSISLCAVDI